MTPKFLKWLRNEYDLTQKELAQKAGYSTAYVAALETGVRPLHRGIENKIMRALGINQQQAYELNAAYAELERAANAN